eukprot:gene10505-4670_t
MRARVLVKIDQFAGTSKLRHPRAVCCCGDGSIVIADYLGNNIVKVDNSGELTTIAGSKFVSPHLDAFETGGWSNAFPCSTATPGFLAVQHILSLARCPTGIAVGKDGASFVVVDQGNRRLRGVDAQGNVTTLAGNGDRGIKDSVLGKGAKFDWPRIVAMRPNGSCVVTEAGRGAVRQMAASGAVTTLGYADGVGAAARFNYPVGIACLSRQPHNVVVADYSNHRIRLVSAGKGRAIVAGGNGGGEGAVVSTLAGSVQGFDDADNKIVVGDYDASDARTRLRIIDLETEHVTTLKVQNPDGSEWGRNIDTDDIAVDGRGNIVCAGPDGIHIIENTGKSTQRLCTCTWLGPGFAAWTNTFWTPTRTCWTSLCSNTARKVVHTMVAIIIRSHQLPEEQGEGSAGLRALPVMPTEMWLYILRLVRPWELGSA